MNLQNVLGFCQIRCHLLERRCCNCISNQFVGHDKKSLSIYDEMLMQLAHSLLTQCETWACSVEHMLL